LRLRELLGPRFLRGTIRQFFAWIPVLRQAAHLENAALHQEDRPSILHSMAARLRLGGSDEHEESKQSHRHLHGTKI
jgi:hypothetical protein